MGKGILMDYGGTIDTNGMHWGEVLWRSYVKYHVPVSKDDFRKAYSFGEKALAVHAFIQPSHNFYDVLFIKLQQQLQFLIANQLLPEADTTILASTIAKDCNEFAASTIQSAEPVLAALAKRYPIVLVSNFYGNIHTVLQNFGIAKYFEHIVESAVVGVRKPDPAIFSLGVKAQNLHASECVVIGDSYSKDIAPGKLAGCQTIWLKGEGWGDDPADTSMADKVITSFSDLLEIL